MGTGASAGVEAAIKGSSDDELQKLTAHLPKDTKELLLKALQPGSSALDPKVAEYVDFMGAQWKKVLDNPQKLIDTAASKRSPFKFEVENTSGEVDLRLGVSAVALPDGDTDFGRRFLAMIDRVQDLCQSYIPHGCKRQTTPHMSIGSVVLDKGSPEEYNDELRKRTGLIASVKRQADATDPPPRAKIQTLKINPDGCITLQLDHDTSQDEVMAEKDFEAALAKIPTCQGEEAAAGERRRFKKNGDGTFTVSRFQQVRLGFGGLGCEVKGMWPSGHMVVVNLVDAEDMRRVPEAKLRELWAKCYEAWSPLSGEWFELKRIVCLCYVERSLNEGSVVVAPEPGKGVVAFPETSKVAQSLLGGIFVAEGPGDVLIDVEKFNRRKANKETGQWQAHIGEVGELAENAGKVEAFKSSEERLLAAFKTFDEDGSGQISSTEVGKVMKSLGEELAEDQVNAMVKKADKDGSGHINYKEFVGIMLHKH